MPAPLDVGKVIVGAFSLPWKRRNDFAHRLAMPFVALVLLGIVQTLPLEALPPVVLWTTAALHLLAFAIFAVICHRLVLAPEPPGRTFVPRWTWRETRFLLLFTLIWAMGLTISFACLAVVTFSTISYGVATHFNQAREVWLLPIVMTLMLLPMYYLLARFSLVLPATAIDRKVGLVWAWKTSTGNSWRLFVVVGILPWMFLAPTFLIDYSAVDAARTVAITIAGTLLLPVEIAALSLAYRELTKDEPATSVPPPASPQTA